MHKKYYLLILALLYCAVAIMGCGDEKSGAKTISLSNEEETKITSSISNEEEERIASFKDSFRTAEKFRLLWIKAMEYEKKSQLDLALSVWEEAYEAAKDRATQTIALIHMASIYERTNSYNNAANLYEEAARLTMNDQHVHDYTAKAEELRQKTGLAPVE